MHTILRNYPVHQIITICLFPNLHKQSLRFICRWKISHKGPKLKKNQYSGTKGVIKIYIHSPSRFPAILKIILKLLFLCENANVLKYSLYLATVTKSILKDQTCKRNLQ